MRALRVLTVDDEELALRRLRLLLRGLPGVEHAGEAASCAEAMALSASYGVDVLLLDVKMRDGDGFAVLEGLSKKGNPPIVILVTAFDHFATRAFETGVADYLVKPVERDRLDRALRRARQILLSQDAEQRLSELQTIVRNLRSAASQNGSTFETEFWVRGTNGIVQVALDEIDCVSSEDDYVAVHTPKGFQLMRGSLRQFEQRVEPGHFVRIHRRWLVRRSAIAELKTPRIGGAQVLLRTGKRIPVGRVYLRQLRRTM